jgi:hypothetical protein
MLMSHNNPLAYFKYSFDLAPVRNSEKNSEYKAALANINKVKEEGVFFSRFLPNQLFCIYVVIGQ